MNPSAGSVVAERYRLERPLGLGGMGAVWLAQHVSLRIPCAVKFIHAQSADLPAVRARFEREAVAAAQLRSPHVVQILDHGVWEGLPYIAMELLEGEDLSRRLRHRRALSPPEVLSIVTQIGRALTKAHALGLVHRDLKPANVFLVRDDDREIAKILDFGIAKTDASLATDGTTKTGSLLGTPFYMSPEQAQGSKSIDHRSDLWALAVLAFECLTGVRPFAAEALGEVFMRIMVRPLPVPSEIAPVPAGFDAWWTRAVCRDPAGRFQTAKELTDALGPALGLSMGDPADLSARPSIVSAVPLGAVAPPTPGAGPFHVPATPGFQVQAPPPGSQDPGMLAVPPRTPGPTVGSLVVSTAPSAAVLARSQPSAAVVAAVGVAAVVLLGGVGFVAWRSTREPTHEPVAITAAPVSMGETPKPPAQPVSMGEPPSRPGAASTPSAPVVVEAQPDTPASAPPVAAAPRPTASAASPPATGAARTAPTARPAAAPRTRDLGF